MRFNKAQEQAIKEYLNLLCKAENKALDVFTMYNSKSYYNSFLPPGNRWNFSLLENFDFVNEEIDLDLAKRMYAQTPPEGFFGGNK